MCSKMLSCWKGSPAAGAGGTYSPEGIEQISTGVYRLSKPTRALEVEIVFIHGLQLFDSTDAYWKTWSVSGKTDDDGRAICWPMTWLAEDVPGARIWSLSYDSTAWRTSTRGNLDEYASAETLIQEMVSYAKIGRRCPIVFVCHSLGGLMVKEIVRQAHDRFGTRKQYRRFLRRIRAFLFYSTPHLGSRLADYVSSMPNMGTMVSQLTVINNKIARLHSDFERIEREHLRRHGNRWLCPAVGESNRTIVPPTTIDVQVVEESSARHGSTSFVFERADHFGVCKPTTKNSVSYLTLVNLIKDVVGEKKKKK